MRTKLLAAFAILLGAPAIAQLTAGEVPAGMSAYDLNVDIVLNANFTADSAAFDFDCDDSFDAWAILVHGYPAVDAPHFAALSFIDSDIEVCADQAPGFQRRPAYHVFGAPLDCSGGYSWQSGAPIILGDLGGFTAIGPYTVTDRYIAYRNAGAIGWIQLSFDILDDGAIELHVDEVLPLCPSTTSIGELEDAALFTLSPNPNRGEAVRVTTSVRLESIEVLDMQGRVIAQHAGTVREIPAPETAGTYLVRVIRPDGRVVAKPLVRYSSGTAP